MIIANDLDMILKVLPSFISIKLEKHPNLFELVEVVIDLGRRPEVRFTNKHEYLSDKVISYYDLFYCIKRVGHFNDDNRAGIERTLHRISSIKNKNEHIIGLTCRVGRAIFGSISSIRDLLESSHSLLILGRPGVGKTTIIREIARILADEMEKRVVIIDTSNEIAGDGNIPHPSIGKARRMQVSKSDLQHQVMVEAIENHMPEVIIIDEIGTELEALAARTIAERGVQLVGTVHGNKLENLMKNPILSDLIGGIQYVTLGDEEARKRGTQKSILERKFSSTFNMAIEIHERNTWIIHKNVDLAVDQILSNKLPPIEHRVLSFKKKTVINETNIAIQTIWQQPMIQKFETIIQNYPELNSQINEQQTINKISPYSSIQDITIKNCKETIYIYAPTLNSRINLVIDMFKLNVAVTKKIDKADILLLSKFFLYSNTKLLQIAQTRKLKVYTVQSNQILELTKLLRYILKLQISIFNLIWQKYCIIANNRIEALEEVRLAVEKIVLAKNVSVELVDRCPEIRKAQNELINRYNLKTRSFGAEPQRRLKIYPRSIDS
uniref:Conserved hypothetical plastid protein n=1 Tax=Corynoplastis japonica TaxID=700918 RepID=A0A1X9PU29_9RHOD|nr:conserved hypothetical plastid protein [Corynoplastis japonica]